MIPVLLNDRAMAPVPGYGGDKLTTPRLSVHVLDPRRLKSTVRLPARGPFLSSSMRRRGARAFSQLRIGATALLSPADADLLKATIRLDLVARLGIPIWPVEPLTGPCATEQSNFDSLWGVGPLRGAGVATIF
jgi:hypothetical protein